MFSLLLSKWRLLVVVGAVAIAFASGWKIAGWRHDAAIKDALEAQAMEFRSELAAAAVVADDERARAREFSLELRQIRRERDIALRELDELPLTYPVPKVIDDDTPCTCDALGTDFWLFFNAPLDSDRSPGKTPASSGHGALR